MARQQATAQARHTASDQFSVSPAQQQHGLSVRPRQARMSPDSVRSDSQPVRPVSQAPRIDAKGDYLSAINEVRSRRGLSVDAMATLAGVPISTMSDALAGKESRNFAGHWLLAQGDDFAADVNDVLGLTPESRRHQRGKRIGELVQLLWEEGA